MGVVLYRHRVAHYVDEGVAISSSGMGPIEGISELRQVRSWVDAYRGQLQRAVEGPAMRHRFHSICPYFAMFPEDFVQKHVVWSKPGALVLDPFSGRGTTIFQALLSDRAAIGGDTNPVAVCVSNAKANPPRLSDLLNRIDNIERSFRPRRKHVLVDGEENGAFFQLCFHQKTLQQLLHLRNELSWKRSRVDAFIAAMSLGVLHGESHKTEWCFSNRMPRTISTKPAYSVKWWLERGLTRPSETSLKFFGMSPYFAMNRQLLLGAAGLSCVTPESCIPNFLSIEARSRL